MSVDLTRWEDINDVVIPKREQEGFPSEILIRETKQMNYDVYRRQ